MNTGELICLIRSKTGLSQEEFARRIGVSRPTVTQWENNDHSPRKSKVLSIVETFDIDGELKTALLLSIGPQSVKDHIAISSGRALQTLYDHLSDKKTSEEEIKNAKKLKERIVIALFDLVIAGEIVFKKGADPSAAANHIYEKLTDKNSPELKMVAEKSGTYDK